MIVKQHIPGFVSGVEAEELFTNSLELLKMVRWVKEWFNDPGFYRLAVHRNYWANASTWPDNRCDQMHLLLAEFDGGYRWWVLAYVSGPDALEVLKELPEWEPKYHERD